MLSGQLKSLTFEERLAFELRNRIGDREPTEREFAQARTAVRDELITETHQMLFLLCSKLDLI